MQKTITNITTNAGQWYDFKVIFDWTTGITDVFRNDTLLGSWTDAAPLTSGKYISFRSGNSKLSVDEIKVFRSRNTTATINVGAASTNDIRYENPDPSTYSAKIKSIVIDSASNLSLINYYNLNIDFSAPSNVTVADGPAADIDTTFIVNTLKANWTAASDANSGIAKYWYAIGSAPGATNICGWTDNGAGLSFTRAGLSLTDGQVYYVSVKSENGSGLQSTAAISDGQLYLISTAIAEAGESNNFTVSPNPLKSESVISFYLSANENISLILFDNSGKQMCVLANGVLSAGQNQFVLNSKKLSLSNGIYYLNFIGEHKSFVTKIIVL